MPLGPKPCWSSARPSGLARPPPCWTCTWRSTCAAASMPTSRSTSSAGAGPLRQPNALPSPSSTIRSASSGPWPNRRAHPKIPGRKSWEIIRCKVSPFERAPISPFELPPTSFQFRLAPARFVVKVLFRFIPPVAAFFVFKPEIILSVKVFSGTANEPLARAICKSIGLELGKITITPFPDGETFVKIEENVRGEDIFIIQPTAPPTNHNLMELFIIIDALRRASATRITAVLPFYGYARQDRKDQPRVPITAKLIANLLVASGANRVLAMDLHAQQIQGFFDIPVDHLYASPVFFEYLAKTPNESLVVCSPDLGGMKMAAAYAEVLRASLGMVAKKRRTATTVDAINVVGEVAGCDILLVDDMTETAGTLMAAATMLRERGARSIRAAVSHCILNEIAYERIKSGMIDELITTNSVR